MEYWLLLRRGWKIPKVSDSWIWIGERRVQLKTFSTISLSPLRQNSDSRAVLLRKVYTPPMLGLVWYHIWSSGNELWLDVSAPTVHSVTNPLQVKFILGMIRCWLVLPTATCDTETPLHPLEAGLLKHSVLLINSCKVTNPAVDDWPRVLVGWI